MKIAADYQWIVYVSQNFDFDARVQKIKHHIGKNISSFSPANVSAGTSTVLTISGTGFGNTVGSVIFSDADNSGSSMSTSALA